MDLVGHNDSAATGNNIEASAPQGNGSLSDWVMTGVRFWPLKATACDDKFCMFVLQNRVIVCREKGDIFGWEGSNA
jgi:hypothetical protein